MTLLYSDGYFFIKLIINESIPGCLSLPLSPSIVDDRHMLCNNGKSPFRKDIRMCTFRVTCRARVNTVRCISYMCTI